MESLQALEIPFESKQVEIQNRPEEVRKREAPIMNVFTFTSTIQSLRVLGILLLLLLTWSSGWASTNQPSDAKVMMNFWAPYYRPAQAIVADGVSICIVNPTSSSHSLTQAGYRMFGPCAFDTGVVQPGKDFISHSLPDNIPIIVCSIPS